MKIKKTNFVTLEEVENIHNEIKVNYEKLMLLERQFPEIDVCCLYYLSFNELVDITLNGTNLKELRDSARLLMEIRKLKNKMICLLQFASSEEVRKQILKHAEEYMTFERTKVRPIYQIEELEAMSNDELMLLLESVMDEYGTRPVGWIEIDKTNITNVLNSRNIDDDKTLLPNLLLEHRDHPSIYYEDEPKQKKLSLFERMFSKTERTSIIRYGGKK